MTKWLVITLAAPIASFGEDPGNAQRATADRPTRSALIGLAGAALGVERADADGQDALNASFSIATHTRRAGSLFSDFHTYQSLPSARGQPRTRADALSRRSQLVTSITRREYRSGVIFQAAYRARAGGRYSLEDLAEAFSRPAHVLYLGRKSCPLSRPVCAELVAAETVIDAFDGHGDKFLNHQKKGLIAVEDRNDLGPSDRTVRMRQRMDDPGDRRRWQFSSRKEYSVSPEDGSKDGKVEVRP